MMSFLGQWVQCFMISASAFDWTELNYFDFSISFEIDSVITYLFLKCVKMKFPLWWNRTANLYVAILQLRNDQTRCRIGFLKLVLRNIWHEESERTRELTLFPMKIYSIPKSSHLLNQITGDQYYRKTQQCPLLQQIVIQMCFASGLGCKLSCCNTCFCRN